LFPQWAYCTIVGDRGMGWQTKFYEPIPLPKGKPLVTLRDAANYITKLPKALHQAPEWLTATQALLLVVERNGDAMLAHIAVMKALHRHEPKAAPTPRRKRAKAYKIV
jgi:hypothetical protein